MKCRKIKNERVENYSGFHIRKNQGVEVIKKTNYFIVDKNVGGDAPKEFIKIYQYGKVRKGNRKKWVGFIAKTGQKWYPAESVTEYLLNQIGAILNLDIAKSQLLFIGSQIRFLSQYFLKKDEILVHAAEIFAGYLSGDKTFVHEIEKTNQARNLFTFQFVKLSVESMFPENSEQIIDSFVKLLIFDAIVGNNDRHIYNWGVIVKVSGKYEPRFSPIYDTARGLFWNDSQRKILKNLKDVKQRKAMLEKYAANSKPKTGWDGLENINHFDLIKFLTNSNEKYKQFVLTLCCDENKKRIFQLLDREFIRLFPSSRIELIKDYIDLRFNKLI